MKMLLQVLTFTILFVCNLDNNVESAEVFGLKSLRVNHNVRASQVQANTSEGTESRMFTQDTEMGLVIHGGTQFPQWWIGGGYTFPDKYGRCGIPSSGASPAKGHSLAVLTSDEGYCTLVVCHGHNWPDMCFSSEKSEIFTSWNFYATLDQPRLWAKAYTYGNSLLLIGGGNNEVSAKTGIELPSGRVFQLNNFATLNFCLIPNGDAFVLAGMDAEDIRYGSLVEKYSSNGEFIGSLPSLWGLPEIRACGTFVDDQGDIAFLVAGGVTEVLYQGAGSWTVGVGPPQLPRYPTGAYNLAPDRLFVMVYAPDGETEVLELSPDKQSWIEVGRINRQGFAAAPVDLVALCT